MWVTIMQLLLLRLASHMHLGNNLHLHHHYNLHIHEASSQKGANIPISSEISGRSPKLAQSTVLCQNRSISIERYPIPEAVFTFIVTFFFTKEQLLKT
jgi:tRNA U34 5-methylaminomethyl-2-thiouridine-forming methyltransferase MnmC